MNIVVSQILTHILKILQMGMLHEIRIQGYEAHQKLTKLQDERAQL
jgi:hypothetical protein